MSETTIRELSFPEDYARMRELWESAGMLGPERSSPERMQEILSSPESAFVAEEDNLVIGGIYMTFALIQGLVVDARYRNRGYGRRLIARAEEALFAKGYSEAELIVDAEKTGWQGWYGRLGYRKNFVGVGMAKDLPPTVKVPSAEAAPCPLIRLFRKFTHGTSAKQHF